MGRTGEVYTLHPHGKRLDKHLEVQLGRPGLDADYFRTGAGLLAHGRPGRKWNLLREWQILRGPNCVSRPFKRIDGHRVGELHCPHHLAGWEAHDVRYTPWT